jgi:aminoglycoside 6'-N-acetyltransferase
VTLRAATRADRPWLEQLLRDERVAGSLSTLATQTLDDESSELLVIEDEGERAGLVCWTAKNRRSRIALVHTVAIDPDRQGRGLARQALAELTRRLFTEHGFHRIEAEVYGFNTAARELFTRAGFTEEGIRRRAYDRHGAWQDGVHFGLLADD